MINLRDYIYLNDGKTKRYKLTCDKCGSDRGHGMKSRSSMLCKKCSHAGKDYIKNIRKTINYKEKMSKAKSGQIPHNKGKSKYSKEQKTLRNNMSAAVRIRLNNRGSSKKGESYLSILGYSIPELKRHLESKFQPGMTWDNYGLYGWHIDHIIPDSAFTYVSMYDSGFKESWKLSNLQPLWAKDNLSKGNRL